MKAFCMKCREQKEMVDGEETKTKNGKPIMKGKCKDCGTKMNKFLPTKK